MFTIYLLTGLLWMSGLVKEFLPYVLLLEHVLLGIHSRNSTLLIVFPNRVMPLSNHQFPDKVIHLYSLVSLCSTSHFLNSNF